MARFVMAALALAACAASANALFFYVVEGQQRCFIEEVPADTLVISTYQNPDFKPYGDPGFTETGIRAMVTDPTGAVVLQKMTNKQGRFAFTSVAGGEHMLCLSTNNTRWFGTPRKFKFDLRVDVGETTIDYTEVAKKEHLSSLEVEIRRLNNKAKDIMSQQAYQREREISFRDTAESTNARVQWWSIGQTVIMIASATWQVLHLKDYFRKKKIV